jgi:hypothetical protein
MVAKPVRRTLGLVILGYQGAANHDIQEAMHRALLVASLLACLSSTACGSDEGKGTGGGGGGGAVSTTTTTTHTSNPDDPFDAARQTCIDKINALRATKGLPPLARWIEAEGCVDQQATADEMADDPHGAWKNGTFASCNGMAQNECLGAGVSGIEGCLDQMWAEKDQAGCSGCDACADAYTPNCPGCDFYGSKTGDVCGHYTNMSAKYFTKAACGFSALGGWDAINFK